MSLRSINVTRYVTPLREGGSLPAIVEADDDGMYVLKFQGAGQGRKALIAELIAGEIGRAIGFRIPEIVFAYLDPILSRTEPDPEIQDLLRTSAGINLALDYLPGSITFDPLVFQVDGRLASEIVWFDCYITNVDRTPRNTNLLVWHKELWLIDHGASLYFQHAWTNWQEQSTLPFRQARDHVLLNWASELDAVNDELTNRLTSAVISAAVDAVPEEWLSDDTSVSAETKREIYKEFLSNRLAASNIFVEEAKHARKAVV